MTQRRGLIVSKGWLQACLLVVLFGFLVLGILAYKTYQDDPPVPARVVDPAGKVLFTRDDSDQGREVVRPLDPWPHSEAGRFHRGISVTLLGLACLIAIAGMLLTPGMPDLLPLAAVLAVALALLLRLARALAATPSGFPGGTARETT